MKNLIFLQNNFVSRTSIIVYNNQSYIIETQILEQTSFGEEKEYKYTLYNEGKMVSVCYIATVELSPATKSVYNNAGFKYLPTRAVELRDIKSIFEKKDIKTNSNITIDNSKNGYAAILLNFAIGDVVSYSQAVGKNIPIIFERTNSPATIEFYQKFNAKENCNGNNHKSYTPMIIEVPMQIDTYTSTIMSQEYIYQDLNLQKE